MARTTIQQLSATQFVQITSLPENPQLGETAFMDGILYIYAELSGMLTWFPLNQPQSYYVHSQGQAALTWTVHHNLGSKDVIPVFYDSDNAIMEPYVQNIQDPETGEWYIEATMAEAVTGYAVVVGRENIDTTVLTAHNVNVSGSLTVDSDPVVTQTEFAAALDELRAEFAAAIA